MRKLQYELSEQYPKAETSAVIFLSGICDQEIYKRKQAYVISVAQANSLHAKLFAYRYLLIDL